MKIKGYKFITKDMKSSNGNITWKLGEWKKHKEKLSLCDSGFHACLTPLQSLSYVYGDKWFIVEAKGKIIHEKDDKFVCSDMRLIKEIPIDKVVKRFALFCAKQCLKNYTKKYPNDNRVSECIRITELYLDGKATLDELNAARSTAESAWSAAWSPAWSAWSTARSAWSTAESAWSAAWSAARSAWSAAWSAARSAESARSAAWSPAWSAAKKEQNKELLRLINLTELCSVESRSKKREENKK